MMQQVSRSPDPAICLGSCEPFETVVARTSASVYELIVLQGDAGDVLVRGGQKFPEFRRVWFAGATAGGHTTLHALKMNTIQMGLRMEFHTADSIVVTSPVVEVSRGEFFE